MIPDWYIFARGTLERMTGGTMDSAAIAGVLTAAAGLIAAVTALVAQWKHANGPAHNPPATSPISTGDAAPGSGTPSG